jgi:hypothetical protein
MLAALDHYGRSTYAPLSRNTRDEIDVIAGIFLDLFANPAFVIPRELAATFVGRNHLISNLVAYSSLGTTDAALERIGPWQANLAKVLVLWSARNSIQYDRAALFQAEPVLASMWYMQYSELFHVGVTSARIADNLRAHFELSMPALLPVVNFPAPYFGASYVDGKGERTVKTSVNRYFQKAAESLVISGPPRDPRKIAVVSANWRPYHSVYRNYSGFVDALKGTYHVTFIQLGADHVASTGGFDEVRVLDTAGGRLDLNPLLRNDFQLILYPDVGMNAESIVLANVRLAPIQACMLGHSVSTFGAAIDYFFSGARVEVADAPEQNYSERLVLLPGMGVIHNRPLYSPRREPASADRIVISCPWHTQKINHALLLALGKIFQAASRPVLFRFFIGAGAKLWNDYPFLHSQIAVHLPPDAFEIPLDVPYADYMAAMERGHLALDSYHFGGCNTVSDAMFLHVPMLCREGRRWYNRIGPAMLRGAGFPELVVDTAEEYVERALRLIHDDPWRESLVERFRRADLDATIYDRSDADHFIAAIDYLIENHGRLKAGSDRAPLRFPRN